VAGGHVTTNGQSDEAATPALHWQYSAKGPTYVLIAMPYRCLVWQTLAGTWGAVVNGHRRSTAAYAFATAEEAKTWCETQVEAGRKRPGHA
jgi:hypothetical protein